MMMMMSIDSISGIFQGLNYLINQSITLFGKITGYQ